MRHYLDNFKSIESIDCSVLHQMLQYMQPCNIFQEPINIILQRIYFHNCSVISWHYSSVCKKRRNTLIVMH